MPDLQGQTRYDAAEVEPRIIERWLASGVFQPGPQDGRETYAIPIPPPNVTGVLHMGHALNNSLQDCLVRFHRMRGFRAKWILGTDHAGIATQTQVERALRAEGLDREDLGREAFVQRVWQWRERYGGTIIEQLKRLGASFDYSDERFTLDEAYVQAVLRVFVSLYEKGYIYRDRYMVNWDPGSRSAISDLEVEERAVTDSLYYIDYPLESGSGAITVATVRPETMLADAAIAVNPNDERYERLIGEAAILPLVGRRLKIIADAYVKPDFGTGALKITPGHDPNDFEIGRRHGLAQFSVIGEDGTIAGEAAPERFRGMPALQAREAVVAELRELGLLSRAESYTHTVPFSHRSGERIEPLISLQWFMRMNELAAPAVRVVRDGAVSFFPDRFARVYLDWMENIRPWCISRQLWWGHRLPVWYRAGETYVGVQAPPGDGWERDPDVLDTWFSSALWPLATLGWPEETEALRDFYPTSALVTGRDIIFLWVARMVMMGLEFRGEAPFSDVYITSIIQAPDGRRMSKSLGTGIDPLDLIGGGERPPVFGEGGQFPAYGADAVRWGLMAMSSGQDVRFAEDKVAQGQALTNKLWNAARLVLLRLPEGARAADGPPVPEDPIEDRWILARLSGARSDIERRIADYDFSQAALRLYDFVYAELCDWYLEMVKPRLYDGDPRAGATLLRVLQETLLLAHPMIPFVTEEIYAYLPESAGLLAGRQVEPHRPYEDREAEQAIGNAISAIASLRAWRNEAGVRPAAVLPARLEGDRLSVVAGHVARLTRLDLSRGDSAGAAATVPVPGGAIHILPSDDLDLSAAERKREAERDRVAEEISRLTKRLSNEGFTSKAPAHVVQADRDKLAGLKAELGTL